MTTSLTIPDRIRVSPATVTLIFSFGSSSAMRACRLLLSMPTARSMMVASLLLFHRIRLVVPTERPSR
ncbi:hypothetical protein D3C81_1842870 [compost metagenome]